MSDAAANRLPSSPVEAPPLNRMLFVLLALAIIAAACSADDAGDTTSIAVAPSELTTTTTMTPSTTTSTTSASTTTSPEASTTTMPPAAITPGEDPDVDAVVLAYQVVFSSETGYEEKAPYLVDPSGLEATVAEYQATGESMGGVALAPTSVTIAGDLADVTYDLLFGGTPTYPDLSGDSVLVDDTWKITREMFCGMMASARVGCPSS